MFKQIRTTLFVTFVLFVSGFMAMPEDVRAIVVVVNSTNDTGDINPGDGLCNTGGMISGAAECTLRAALQESNAVNDSDTIEFNIPTTDPGYSMSPLSYTISPLSALPKIIHPVILDATSQPDYVGDPIVQLDGSIIAMGATSGLVLLTNNSIISGFIVHSFPKDGLVIDGSSSFGDINSITNNWVGINASQIAQGNGDNGILITLGASGNMIDGNVVGGNVWSGIVLGSAGTEDNIVQGNFVGVGPDGSSDIGNGMHGINLLDQVTNNQIGGTVVGETNLIVNNQGQGVALSASAGNGNSILGNSIFNNAELGIDLNLDGVTANDPGDGDTGPNDLLNFPVLTLATIAGGVITIEGSLSGAPSGTYRIEFFANMACDASGFGEGETLLGSTSVTTDGSGSSVFMTAIPGSDGQGITATATEDLGAGTFGSTSEFSECVTAMSNDSDGDGIPDDQDTCPFDPDNDIDNDGVCGDVDGCPNDGDKTDPGVCGCGTPDTDSDNDGILDCNDICPGSNDTVDSDIDGIPDGCDNCPLVDNTDQLNSDSDTFGDVCDNCPKTTNQDQADFDNDGTGDVCELLILNPIFPGLANNVNSMTVEQAIANKPVAFVWGFQQGLFIVDGSTCNGIELGIKPLQLLWIVNAGPDQIANFQFFVPGWLPNLVFTQAVEISTCRTSDVVQNILRNN